MRGANALKQHFCEVSDKLSRQDVRRLKILAPALKVGRSFLQLSRNTLEGGVFYCPFKSNNVRSLVDTHCGRWIDQNQKMSPGVFIGEPLWIGALFKAALACPHRTREGN